MKKIIFFLILSLYNYSVFGQDLSDKLKQEILNKLFNYENNENLDAIYDAIKYNLPEALPIMEGNFWKIKLFNRSEYLLALYKYNSAHTRDFALRHLDSLQSIVPKDLLEEKLKISSKIMTIKVLFLLKDFSKTEYIFDLIENNKHIEEIIELLSLIIKSDFSESNRAKEILKNIIINNTDEVVRLDGIYYYENSLENNAIEFLINIFLTDNSPKVRLNILSNYFVKYKTDEIKSAIRQKIYQENDGLVKKMSAIILLKQFNSLENYELIKNIYLNENELSIKTSIGKYLDRFILSKPSEIVKIETMLDTLTNYSRKCFNLTWINDNSYLEMLDQILQSAYNSISSVDSLTCYKQIKLYQTSIQQVYSDSAGSYPKYVSKDAYKFLYYYPKYILERLPSPPTVKLEDSQGKLLLNGSLQYYEGGWKPATNNGDGTFYIDTKLKTVSLRMTYEYGSQTMNNVALDKDAIVFKTVETKVKLIDSKGAPLDTGTVQYYAGGWRNFGKTVYGVASKELLPVNYSFRITYGYASNDKAQNLDSNSTVTFTTINTQVELRNSEGQLIDGGEVQYYSGGWRVFGTASGGISQKELLPNNYTFGITYAYASNDKQQNTAINPIVVFNTVKANVELRDSRNNLMDLGVVQYYSGGWREFGTTQNGTVSKELLPNNYSFRMSFAFSSNDKQQNIGTNPTVVFQTVNTTVELRNSQNNLIGEGTVQYYSGGWRNIGPTVGGQVNRELLPNNYSFRMAHEYLSLDKAQNIGTLSVVTFNTVLSRVRVSNNQNQPINNATVRYYAGAWRNYGITSNGEVTKELLPVNLTLRAIVGTIQQDKTQNLLTNPLVEFTF